VAGTRIAAVVLVVARPGLTVIARGEEAEALAPIAFGILEKIPDDDDARAARMKGSPSTGSASRAVSAFK
jgi:hypothetical protein